MYVDELDFLGVFPFEKETPKEFSTRGETFLQKAYELKDDLKQKAIDTLEQNNFFKKHWYQFGMTKKRKLELADETYEYFISEYNTNPDWVSIIEGEQGYFGGQLKWIKLDKTKIPIAEVSFGKEDDLEYFKKIKRHEIIECIRDPLSAYVHPNSFILPWRSNEWLPEENSINRLSKIEKYHPSGEIAKVFVYGNIYLGSISEFLAVLNSDTGYSVGGIGLFYMGYKFYDSLRKINPTLAAYDKILLSEEEDSAEKKDVQYSLLRLKPPEFRNIAKTMKDTDSGINAIKEFLKKRKNLQSEIILNNIL